MTRKEKKIFGKYLTADETQFYSAKQGEQIMLARSCNNYFLVRKSKTAGNPTSGSFKFQKLDKK